jgi:hypothetical protein
MNAPETEHEAKETLVATNAESGTIAAAGQSSGVLARTLIVGVLLAAVGGWISWDLAERFRALENVEFGTKYRGTQLVIGIATQNAVVAYALLGAILSFSLGVTAACFLGRYSMARVLSAGLAGIVLGASFAAASSYGLTPIYFHRMETADVTLSMLIHLGIWAAVGAASGIAFGIGSGTRKDLIGSFIGGVTGAAFATMLFDVCGVFFPLARTERPLSEEANTRLAAAVFLSLSIALGICVVVFQKPTVKTKSI